MANENVLTHPFLRPGYGPQGEDERRHKALSRTTSTVLAAALHVLFFLFFVFAVHPFDMRSTPIVETFLTLPVPGNNLPNGSLVMLPTTVMPRLKENSTDPQFATSGAAQIQNDLARGLTPNSGGCQILQNTPCLHPAEGDGFKIGGN